MKLHQVLFFLLVALIPTQLGVHFWPSWSFVLGRRIDYLSPTIFLTDTLIGLVLFFWFIDARTRSRKHEARSMDSGQRPGFSMIQDSVFMLPVVMYVVVNILAAKSQPVAVIMWLRAIECLFLGVYIVRTRPVLRLVAYALTVGVFYSSVLAVVQFWLQRSVGGVFWFFGERTFAAATPGIARATWCPPLQAATCVDLLRAYATFPHPNVLAGFLVAALPPMLAFWVHGEKKRHFSVRVVWILRGTILLSFVALAVTFSRSAWFVATSVVALFILRVVSGRRKIVALVTTILLIALLASLPYVQALAGESESVGVRKDLSDAALSVIRARPLLGAGLGNFLVVLPEHLVERSVYFLQPVHSIYLLLLSELGIVGACLVLLSLILLARYAFGKKAVRNIEREAFVFSLGSVLLLGFVDHYALTLQQGRLLLTVLFSTLAASRTRLDD